MLAELEELRAGLRRRDRVVRDLLEALALLLRGLELLEAGLLLGVVVGLLGDDALLIELDRPLEDLPDGVGRDVDALGLEERRERRRGRQLRLDVRLLAEVRRRRPRHLGAGLLALLLREAEGLLAL